MKTIHIAVGLALLALWTPPSGAATFTASVRASSSTASKSGPTDATARRGTAGWQLAAVSAVQSQVGGGDGQGNGAARAWVSPGGLQLFAEAGGSSAVIIGQMTGGGSANASGSFDDAFSLRVPGCSNPAVCGNGRKGFMSFAIAVEGSFGGSGSGIQDGPGTLAGWSGSAGWSADLRVNAGFISSGNTDPTSASWTGGQSRSETNTSGPVNTGTGSFAVREFTVAFVFGQAINVHLAGSTNATSNNTAFVGSPSGFANASSMSRFASDLSHTIAWSGISKVSDAAGRPLSGWTALSPTTGFDYAHAYVTAVPEPESWLMGLCGVVALYSRRRHFPRG